MAETRLRPASDRDWTMIRSWLNLPEIERWWGPAAMAEAEVIQALGSNLAIARIILVNDTPAGYGHAVDAMTWGDDLPDDLQAGTWDLDVFVGEPAFRGHGFGGIALGLLRDEVFSTTLATAVSVFAPIGNEQAVRAYEKAGFHWKRIWHDPKFGPEWFMVSERPQA